MAEPQKQPRAQASIVASCTATDCTYNENEECHAGEIRVQSRGNTAVCGTYDPETPKPRP